MYPGPTAAIQNPERPRLSDSTIGTEEETGHGHQTRPEIVQPWPSYAIRARDPTTESADCSAWRSSTVIANSLATHRASFRWIRSRSR